MNALPKLLNFCLLPLMAVSLNAASYKVKSGDTLSSIARNNGTTSSQLMKDNGISNPNLLRVGQVLKVSGNVNDTPLPHNSSQRPATTSGNYTVKAGDTLYSIARNNGLSVSQLSNLNPGLNPAKISIGQKLTTKGSLEKSTSKPKATPKPKESMTVIAQKQPEPTPTPVAPVKIATNTIPAPIPAPKEKPSLTAERKIELPSSISTVMVKKEIAFGQLASQHRTTPKQLNELNGWTLKPTIILAKGSEIYVPGS